MGNAHVIGGPFFVTTWEWDFGMDMGMPRWAGDPVRSI